MPSATSPPAAPVAILIAGPTASGKSALALEIAAALGGTIVNADSMQVYAEMRVLTARPSPQEESVAPHRLYGHVPARQAYSAGRYLREMAACLDEIRGQGRLAVIVGGTGLYLKALTQGLSPIPEIPSEIRSYWRRRGTQEGAGDLHRELTGRDPEMAARLGPADTQRLVRALEVIEATGQSLADWQRVPGRPLLPIDETVPLVVLPERAWLYERCDARFDAMVATGAVDEARAMMALGLDPSLPAMRALGLRALIAHLEGRLTLTAAAEAAKTETRQYAKRQLTWLRRNNITWNTTKPDDMNSAAQKIITFIKHQR